MGHGYANDDSYAFDVVWANDHELYEAIKSHARAMRPVWEVMSNQTLGRNLKDAIRAMVNDGGWGWRSCPDEFVAVRSKAILLLDGIDLNRISEDEFGANIRAALGDEDFEDKFSQDFPLTNRLANEADDTPKN